MAAKNSSAGKGNNVLKNFEIDLPRFQADMYKMMTKKEQRIIVIGRLVERLALTSMRSKVPIDTGALYDGLSSDLHKEAGRLKWSVRLFSEKEYWHFVEWGTRNQSPKPFVRPAVKQGRSLIKQAL